MDRQAYTKQRQSEYLETYAKMTNEELVSEALADQMNWASDRCTDDREHAGADAEYAALTQALLQRMK